MSQGNSKIPDARASVHCDSSRSCSNQGSKRDPSIYGDYQGIEGVPMQDGK